MRYLNLGCGWRYLENWTNVDFTSNSPAVVAHNLTTGIPFSADSFDVVYHSHLLEHFPKPKATVFMGECHRVLKPGGIIRVVVPDLEQITREYLTNLERAKAGDKQAARNYEWIMLELYDQAVRDASGGGMAAYWKKKTIVNESYLVSRIGHEFTNYRKNFLHNEAVPTQQPNPSRWKQYFSLAPYKKLLIRYLAGYPQANRDLEVGRFRSGGEIHQWMYDEYSLGMLLIGAGFKNVQRKSAHESQIPNWEKHIVLDVEDGKVRKPDSLFLEATK